MLDDDKIEVRRVRRLIEDYDQNETYDPETDTYSYVVVYTGIYYCRPYDKKEMRRVKLTYSVLIIAGIVLFFAVAIPSFPLNMVWYTALAQTLYMFGALISVCCLIRFLSVPIRMKKKEYRFASVALRVFVLFPAVTSLFMAGAAAVYLIQGIGSPMSNVLCIIAYLLNCLCFATVFYREATTKYTTQLSGRGPEDEL